MQKLEIIGGRKISGTIAISGSKNATLPILASTILSKKKIIITNIPIVKDVETMLELLSFIGSKIVFEKKEKRVEIFNNKPLKTFAPAEDQAITLPNLSAIDICVLLKVAFILATPLVSATFFFFDFFFCGGLAN